jgi:folate-dependent tRNA-U54 methylase TrmFO/GidA
MDKEQYEAFIDALLAGEKTEFKEWENVPYFDGCLPIEVMAERGRETLRHGPMKPVGLTNRAQPDRSRPMPSSSCARTTRWARCGTWSASRPS